MEAGFTEITPNQGFRYLLVFICTFSGWVEAFPTWTEKARQVTKALLKDVVPRYRIPLAIGSNNGLAFVAYAEQEVAKAFKTQWTLHTTYHSQSSGKVERMNQTLKQTVAKHCQLILGRHVACSPLKSEEFALGRDRVFAVWNPLWMTTLASQLKGRHQRAGNLDLYRQGYATQSLKYIHG